MTPSDWGRLAVKVILLWTALSIVFGLFVWPHLAKRIEDEQRRAAVARQRKALDQAMEIERADFDKRLKAEATRIIKKLDEEAAQDFALEVDAAQAYLEYRAATDGRRTA